MVHTEITLHEIQSDDCEKLNEYLSEYRRQCSNAPTFDQNPDNLPFDEFFTRLVNLSHGFSVPDGFAATKYYLICLNGEIIGQANISYEDNDFILNFKGHIGYSIAPWERGKGYAKQALKLLVCLAARMGVDPIILTCDPENEASRRVILSAGAHLCDTDSRYGKEKEIYSLSAALVKGETSV